MRTAPFCAAIAPVKRCIWRVSAGAGSALDTIALEAASAAVTSQMRRSPRGTGHRQVRCVVYGRQRFLLMLLRYYSHFSAFLVTCIRLGFSAPDTPPIETSANEGLYGTTHPPLFSFTTSHTEWYSPLKASHIYSLPRWEPNRTLITTKLVHWKRRNSLYEDILLNLSLYAGYLAYF